MTRDIIIRNKVFKIGNGYAVRVPFNYVKNGLVKHKEELTLKLIENSNKKFNIKKINKNFINKKSFKKIPIQIELGEEVDKNLKIFTAVNNFNSKSKALEFIIEQYFENKYDNETVQ